jgi:hypothetical protein
VVDIYVEFEQDGSSIKIARPEKARKMKYMYLGVSLNPKVIN